MQCDLGTGAWAEFGHKQYEQPKTLKVASFTFRYSVSVSRINKLHISQMHINNFKYLFNFSTSNHLFKKRLKGLKDPISYYCIVDQYIPYLDCCKHKFQL